MSLKIWTSIKWWWKSHVWVDIRKNYVLSKKGEVFWLTDKQITLVNQYKKEFNPKFITYMFTPGPVGTCVKIRGKKDDIEKDITDYDCW